MQAGFSKGTKHPPPSHFTLLFNYSIQNSQEVEDSFLREKEILKCVFTQSLYKLVAESWKKKKKNMVAHGIKSKIKTKCWYNLEIHLDNEAPILTVTDHLPIHLYGLQIGIIICWWCDYLETVHINMQFNEDLRCTLCQAQCSTLGNINFKNGNLFPREYSHFFQLTNPILADIFTISFSLSTCHKP